MTAGAGVTSESGRRWRLLLTIGAWTLIVQSALVVLFGLLSLTMRSLLVPASLAGVPPDMLAFDVEGLLRGVRVMATVSPFANLVLLAGSIGLLRREKWGWYVVVLVHLASVVLLFIWGMPLMRAMLGVLVPGDTLLPALGMTVLTALAPLSVVAYLMLKGITSQFERQTASEHPAQAG